MNNEIDIVDFAKNILGIKINLSQEIILRKLYEHMKINKNVCLCMPPRVARTTIKNIIKENSENF